MPDAVDKETDVSAVENESPRGEKYNLRPNPTPTLLMNTDTRQKSRIHSPVDSLPINSTFMGLVRLSD